MRVALVLLALTTALCAGPACAASLRIPDEPPPHAAAYASPAIAEPWVGQRALPVIREKPIGELIATRLGLVEGSAELFRYRVENAPSESTVLNGVIDGGGIRLKLTW
ncbi:MAG TPA: hypothetical protein VGC36_05190 [Rhizomicrobium sp.]